MAVHVIMSLVSPRWGGALRGGTAAESSVGCELCVCAICLHHAQSQTYQCLCYDNQAC